MLSATSAAHITKYCNCMRCYKQSTYNCCRVANVFCNIGGVTIMEQHTWRGDLSLFLCSLPAQWQVSPCQDRFHTTQLWCLYVCQAMRLHASMNSKSANLQSTRTWSMWIENAECAKRSSYECNSLWTGQHCWLSIKSKSNQTKFCSKNKQITGTTYNNYYHLPQPFHYSAKN